MNNQFDKNFYYNFRNFVQCYMKLIYRINITGAENIPTDTNYILAGNHLNILDSWLLMIADSNYLRFLVDNKLYRYRHWEWFLKKLGTVGTNPDQVDIKSLKELINLLKEGKNLVIFPEGHTHNKDIHLEYKSGVAKMSRLTNVTIVPFGIYGSYKPFHKINLNFGKPINYNQIKLPNNEIDKDLEIKIKNLIIK